MMPFLKLTPAGALRIYQNWRNNQPFKQDKPYQQENRQYKELQLKAFQEYRTHAIECKKTVDGTKT